MNPDKMSGDSKPEEILLCMEGEYMYYVENDMENAVHILKQAIEKATNKNYPRMALLKIYIKSGLINAEQELNSIIRSSKTNDHLPE
jgi:hypothetical protein